VGEIKAEEETALMADQGLLVMLKKRLLLL